MDDEDALGLALAAVTAALRGDWGDATDLLSTCETIEDHRELACAFLGLTAEALRRDLPADVAVARLQRMLAKLAAGEVA